MIIKRIFKIFLCVLLALILLIGGYVLYVVFSYSRIEDNLALIPDNKSENLVKTNEEYTIVTQNIGFGAYTADFTFFMDGGKESRARSKESVINCVNSAATKVLSLSPDFVLFQEVDTSSTRSYHVNEENILKESFSSFSSVFATNYHSAYLFYPILCPHGASNSGILTFANTKISSSLRKSLPISTSFSKFLDLDRCFSVSRLPIDGGKELIIYNVHLSAYGGSDEIRHAQMSMLFSDMQSEYEKGNYCVAGGDFNHDFTGDSTKKLNGGEEVEFGWAMPFPNELLSEYKNVSRATDYTNDTLTPTCRNCDVAYEEGNFTIVVDGFLTTSNVTVNYLENVSTDFVYSDHNPVVMKFELNTEI